MLSIVYKQPNVDDTIHQDGKHRQKHANQKCNNSFFLHSTILVEIENERPHQTSHLT